MRVRLIRVHEDGSCARWLVEPTDLRLVIVIPAKPTRGSSQGRTAE